MAKAAYYIPTVNARAILGGQASRATTSSNTTASTPSDTIASTATFDNGNRNNITESITATEPSAKAADASKPPPAKRLKYENHSTITVLVGSSKTSFNVHESFVCNVSLFFQKVCNSSFKEALDKVVCLPEADSDAFDVFMEWVYTRMIKFPKWPLDKTSQADSGVWWLLVVKLYLLANYLQCTSFGNAVLESVGRAVARKHATTYTGKGTTTLLYNSTLGPCGMRALFVALHVWKLTTAQLTACESKWNSYFKGFPEEYLVDLIIMLQRKTHQLEQDPFANEKACQVFRDTEIACEPVEASDGTVNQPTSAAQT